MKKVNFTELKNGSKEEYLMLDKHEQDYINGTANRILKFFEVWVFGTILVRPTAYVRHVNDGNSFNYKFNCV